MASLSVSGLVPISAAIAGSEVAITVEVHVLHEQGDRHDQRHDAFCQHAGLDRKVKFRGGKLTESPPVRIAGIVRRLTQPHMGDRSFGGLPPER